jgi:group I intron endonuclease
MIIYKAYCAISNKCYIGKTTKSLEIRKHRHIANAQRGSICHFHSALRKYGEAAFKWKVVQVCSSIENLNECEKLWIRISNSFTNGYNSTTGGDGGIVSEETRKRMSDAQIGHIVTKETRQKISDGHIGKALSTAHKKALSDAHKDKSLTDEHKQAIHEGCKNMSNDRKERISKSLSGYKRPRVICPHCGKEGANNGMKRCHFDNCKWKVK